ncbi:POTRA domain-containing protein [Lacinutrix sp. MEBiC02404]
MSKSFFLPLILCILFSSEAISQQLYLKVTGETELETKRIDSISYQKKHIDLNTVKKEIDSLQIKLFQIGYIENDFQDLNKENDSTYSVLFRLKHRYHNIHIYYDEAIIGKSVLEQVSNLVYDDFFILPFNSIERSLYSINSKISDQGFPFSEITLQDISVKNKTTLKATLVLKETLDKRTIDKIILKGYEKFPKSYLKHYLKLKKRKTFNLSEIKKKTEVLKELKFANQIKEPEVLFTKDSTILYLYLKKAKSNNFDGFLGFGTNETTNKIDFNGYLNLNLNNNLNTGESFQLIYKSDENEQKTFNANLSLPYLFNSPLGAEVGLQIFKKDSSFTTVNQIAKLFYQINPQTRIHFGINSTKSNSLLSESNTLPEIQDYNSNIYNLRFTYNKLQNNFLFDKNLFLALEVGNGKRSFANNTENQTLLFIDAFKIFNLNKKNSAYIRINGSGLFSKNYLENELFRFGGINSIRGFEENSLTASLYALTNTEYRYQLSNSLYIHSIIDFSYLENTLTSQKEKLYGFGFGFGLLTKAGLLKFNYANGKSENQKFKFSNSKIHLSLTAIF